MLHPQEEARFKNEIARFKKRLLAIVNGPAVRWREQFKNQPLADLLKEFNNFAHEYFDYIAKTYPSESETSLSQDLSTALGSLQQEWAVISRACEQREIEEFKEWLAKADAYAQNYYSRFLGYKVSNADPITYFEKLYAITRYAFTPYPLISIPLYVFNDPSQWLALAHELGHFVFWNSTKLSAHQEVQTRLRNAVLKALSDLVLAKLKDLSVSVSAESYDYFQKQPIVIHIYMNWLEEIFADVCGTLLAGPAYVISGQRRVAEMASTPDALIADDELHPAPYLRPLIGLETLKWVAGQLEGNVQEVAAKEQLGDIITHLKDQWKPLQEKSRRKAHKDSGLKMSVIEKAIPVIVQVILEGCKNGGGSRSWGGAKNLPDNLGRLVNYKEWLGDLPEVKAALSEDSAPKLSSALKALVKPEFSPGVGEEDRVKFEELVQHLEKVYKTDKKKVREVLLSLEIGKRQPAVCSEREVKYVGYNKGYYKRCY